MVSLKESSKFSSTMVADADLEAYKVVKDKDIKVINIISLYISI